MNASLPSLARRQLLAAGALSPAGCASPLPLTPAPDSERDAFALLRASADAHGLANYRGIADINVSYAGTWRPLIARIQPQLIDPGFRSSSQERLMPSRRLIGQTHTGNAGHKQVSRRRGDTTTDDPGQVSVWQNDVPCNEAAVLQSSALVADGYCLFLLGPLWLVDLDLPVRLAGSERVDGRRCDLIEAWLTPGLGSMATDRLVLWIDRENGVMRRMRFTLEGFDNTKGAIAEVETYDHVTRFGVTWPTRFYERLKHPLPLPVHDWQLTGLDVDRGYLPGAIVGERFSGSAMAPAAPL